jgi:hypothetical protein
MADTYLPAMRCPVYRRRDPDPGFRTELENLIGDAKGKDAMGQAARQCSRIVASINAN